MRRLLSIASRCAEVRLAALVAAPLMPFVLALVLQLSAAPAQAAAPASVFLEDLTWPELRDAQHAGRTTVIVPVGGTEQSGPALALGKHNVRVKILAQRIAESLGTALVAPVISYVPEGSITPPAGHMRFPGTISISDAAFQGLLEGTARSLRQGGFTDIVLIGDHGGYQTQMKAIAQRLDHEWTSAAPRAPGPQAHVHFIDAYYRVTQTEYVQFLRGKGLTPAQVGEHAGTSDTALMLATDPSLVRTDAYARAAGGAPGNGVNGDPRPATTALGQAGVELIVSRTVSAIRQATAARQ